MKGSIVFDGDMDIETVSKLINEIDSKLKEYEQIRLFFSSGGGECKYADILTNYLIEHKDKIELIGFGTLGSSGFDVFDYYLGKKSLSNFVILMLHLTDVSQSYVDSKILNSQYSKDMDEDMKNIHRVNIDRYKQIGVSKKHLKRIKKGEDVWLFPQDIAKLDILK